MTPMMTSRFPGPGDEEGLVEGGPSGELAGGFVDVDLLATGGAQRVALAVGVLVAGGDPPVAEPHDHGANPPARPIVSVAALP